MIVFLSKVITATTLSRPIHPPACATDNTPDIVVNSLIEGGLAIRGASHRHLLPLLACHCSDTEQPMLLFPKTSQGPLKQLLLRAREPKAGGTVSQTSALCSSVVSE